MHGWASVGHGVDICLSDNTAHSTKKDKKKKKEKRKQKKKTDKQNTGRQRGRAAQKIIVQNALYHCTNRSENKLTIHLLHFYFHFPLNHEVRA